MQIIPNRWNAMGPRGEILHDNGDGLGLYDSANVNGKVDIKLSDINLTY